MKKWYRGLLKSIAIFSEDLVVDLDVWIILIVF